MSTKVSYKGAQIAEVGTQQTKTLLTAGKYCEADFTLANDDNPVAEENDVIFIDYDGTIRYSYSAEEFLALTALPPNPTHEGLTAQGWNWTLADAKEYVGNYGMQVIGQNYNTSSGSNEFVFYLQEPFLTPAFAFTGSTAGTTATVDWGDGNSESYAWTGYGVHVFQHTFASQGRYRVKVNIANGFAVIGPRTDAPYSRMGFMLSDIHYIGSLKEAYVGNNTGLKYNAFTKCIGLEKITLPLGSVTNGTYEAFGLFRECKNLKALVVPEGGNCTSSDSNFNQCSSLVYVSLPKSTTALAFSCFRDATFLKKVISPEGVSVSTAGYTFAATRSLSYMLFGNSQSLICIGTAYFEHSMIRRFSVPDTVQNIKSNAFYNCIFLYELTFLPTTPATVENSNAFTNLNTSCIFYVPFSALAAYLTGTNYPNPATYTYIGFATYSSGAALPTQDSTDAYNVTWYATKADAIAETNAITEGNGKEICCRYAAVA